MLLIGSACAGSGEGPAGGGEETGESVQNQEASAGGDSFVLCPVIEKHKDELAAILGFGVDPERGVETFSSECNIRGFEPGDFARVLLVPAFIPSIEVHVEGYEGASSPVSELDDGAVFIESDFQPHIVFLMGGLIIDVDAEVIDYETGLTAPPRDAMIAYALRVRELLAEANA